MPETTSPRSSRIAIGGRTRRSVHAVILAVLLLVGVAGCGDDDASDSTDATPTTVGAATYRTTAFSWPFEVAVPGSLGSRADVDEPRFVTWEPGPGKPAVRVLAPVVAFAPGGAEATPAPADLLAYVLAQAEHGATLTDRVEATVDGHPATLLTATTKEPLEGSLGCPREGMEAGDCFGLQPELALRLAIIDLGDVTLLAWARHDRRDGDATTDFAPFEDMLSTLRFVDADPSSAERSTAATPLDGVWSTTVSEADLAGSPLLYDRDEVNDQNWGDFTLTFGAGEFTLTQENPRTTSEQAGTFEVEDDVLSMTMEGIEHFEMRWHLDGERLTLTRDEALGVAPTPWVLGVWTRTAG